MRCLPVVLAGLLLAVPLHGQDSTGQVRGVVTGTLGDPVEGAEIRLVGTGHSATTDANGWFAIRGLAKGDYIAEVRRIGFKAQRLGASVEGDEIKEVKIILERGAYELPEVAVTVRQLKPIEYGWTSRYDDFFRRKHVGLGAFIMREQIDRRGAGRTPSLLTGIRGVRLKFRHPGVSGTDVEIIGCSRVSVWIDGQKQRYADVPLPARVSGPKVNFGGLRHAMKEDNSGAITASHLERVLPSQIEMIEVYRGPAEMPAEYIDDSCAAIAVWTR
ncbi:MAG: carboxypeptidase regulatory-like domain-containing protein [Gemmatimonadales bacterium]